MVDSHCHLAGPEFTEDLSQVIERARTAGVAHALVILAGDDEPEIEQGRKVAVGWDAVRFSVGIHPHAAGRFAADPTAAARAVDAVADGQPLTRALGEIGLDYHYDFAPRDVQNDEGAAKALACRAQSCAPVSLSRQPLTLVTL